MSKTHDHQLESSLSPVEVFTKTSASLEMHQGVSEERIHLGSSPKKGKIVISATRKDFSRSSFICPLKNSLPVIKTGGNPGGDQV